MLNITRMATDRAGLTMAEFPNRALEIEKSVINSSFKEVHEITNNIVLKSIY